MKIFTMPNQSDGSKRKVKRFIAKWLAIMLVIFILCFSLLYFISKWYDNHQLIFQQPIFVKLQSVLLIHKRFAVAPVPKATYIEVNPLTTPQDIVDAAKSGTIPQYLGSATIQPVDKETIRQIVKNKVIQKFGASSWPQIDYLIEHESGYQQYVVNKSSGACGIFQALPCTKLPSLDLIDQLNWGLNVYIPERYGSAQAAYNHEVANNWY